MSGILSRVRSALGKVHPPRFLKAHHISTTSANNSQRDKPPNPAPEGTIPFVVDGETHHTWYRVFGDLASKSVPLVVVHGGPGMAHDYLIPVSDLQKTRPVIFYDQLGNNRSTHLPDKPQSFWTIDLFIDELVNLVNYFGISPRYDILGHSWGGMLASEFVIRRQPTGLRKLVVADSLPAMELWNKSNEIFKKELPEEIQEDLKLGLKDKIRYRKALEVHYSRHGCTLDPPPKEIASAVLDPIFGDRETGEGGDPTVSIAMNTGPLIGWTIVDGLHKINVPTLLLNGRADMAQDFVVQPFFDRVPKIKWLTFEKSSHVPMWEERERFMEVVEHFLESED